jgi:sporulation protein YlmC with PRC-barrel domain
MMIATDARRDIMHTDERLKELEERYEGYEVYDDAGEKIGKVDDLFIDEADREEYIGVKMGLFGLSGKTLIPMEIAHVDEQQRRIEVDASKDQVKNAPRYHDEDDIDHAFEARIREHFGLERQTSSPERGTYGHYEGATESSEPDEETREVPLDQPVVLIRVRRVRIEEEPLA